MNLSLLIGFLALPFGVSVHICRGQASLTVQPQLTHLLDILQYHIGVPVKRLHPRQ